MSKLRSIASRLALLVVVAVAATAIAPAPAHAFSASDCTAYNTDPEWNGVMDVDYMAVYDYRTTANVVLSDPAVACWGYPAGQGPLVPTDGRTDHTLEFIGRLTWDSAGSNATGCAVLKISFSEQIDEGWGDKTSFQVCVTSPSTRSVTIRERFSLPRDRDNIRVQLYRRVGSLEDRIYTFRRHMGD